MHRFTKRKISSSEDVLHYKKIGLLVIEDQAEALLSNYKSQLEVIVFLCQHSALC